MGRTDEGKEGGENVEEGEGKPQKEDCCDGPSSAFDPKKASGWGEEERGGEEKGEREGDDCVDGGEEGTSKICGREKALV